MSEGKPHWALKERARGILLEKGFKENEIFFEYPTGLRRKDKGAFVIDVAGIRGDYKVFVECGTLAYSKQLKISEMCDELIYLPHEDAPKRVKRLPIVTVRLSITIPDKLSELFNKQCMRLSRSRSGYIQYLIKQELEKSLNPVELKKMEEK